MLLLLYIYYYFIAVHVVEEAGIIITCQPSTNTSLVQSQLVLIWLDDHFLELWKKIVLLLLLIYYSQPLFLRWDVITLIAFTTENDI